MPTIAHQNRALFWSHKSVELREGRENSVGARTFVTRVGGWRSEAYTEERRRSVATRRWSQRNVHMERKSGKAAMGGSLKRGHGRQSRTNINLGAGKTKLLADISYDNATQVGELDSTHPLLTDWNTQQEERAANSKSCRGVRQLPV